MNALRFEVIANLYQDSVALMQVAAKLRALDGVEQASCLMATPANLAQLVDAGLEVEVRVAPSDLLVVVRGTEAACEAALDVARELLLRPGAPPGAARGGDFELPLTSLALGVARAPQADLALISVPGDYAAAEALKALALGLHVMIFSDNVPLDEEVAVKRFARRCGRLVMGPDCGTAIVNGVPLGFANVVRRGDIGLVAASGTGLQEVTCRIHALGGGVSQALGTGGRDLHEAVGGLGMLQGLEALAADARTRVIVLVSKPPAAAIAQRILDAAAAAGKPVVVHFLGAAPAARAGVHPATSLRHAADVAVALAGGRPPPGDDAPPPAARSPLPAAQRAVRGLFTGGTFCYEAQLAFLGAGLACTSNAPVHGVGSSDGRPFAGHVFLDLGDDAYTRGRPHPMIDPGLRNAMLREQAGDATVGALLFDVVLGHGAHADPAHELAAALEAALAQAHAQGRALRLIGHVCGTEGDPQDKAAQVARLEAAGATIVGSNIEAARLAARLAGGSA